MLLKATLIEAFSRHEALPCGLHAVCPSVCLSVCPKGSVGFQWNIRYVTHVSLPRTFAEIGKKTSRKQFGITNAETPPVSIANCDVNIYFVMATLCAHIVCMWKR